MEVVANLKVYRSRGRRPGINMREPIEKGQTERLLPTRERGGGRTTVFPVSLDFPRSEKVLIDPPLARRRVDMESHVIEDRAEEAADTLHAKQSVLSEKSHKKP